MKDSKHSFRWRKYSDVDRKYAIFELLADESILLDVAFSDERVFEVAFHQAISGWVVNWERLEEMIEEGKRIAIADQSPL